MSSDRAREIYQELRKLARADYQGATGSLLVVYGVEGFLRRLAASGYATKMALKGGMLMAGGSASTSIRSTPATPPAATSTSLPLRST